MKDVYPSGGGRLTRRRRAWMNFSGARRMVAGDEDGHARRRGAHPVLRALRRRRLRQEQLDRPVAAFLGIFLCRRSGDPWIMIDLPGESYRGDRT